MPHNFDRYKCDRCGYALESISGEPGACSCGGKMEKWIGRREVKPSCTCDGPFGCDVHDEGAG